MYDLGLRLKTLRLQRGLTQKMLATRIHKSKAAVGSYESNRQMPPLDVLISIAGTLNVSLDYLVGFEKSEYYSTKSFNSSQIEVLDLLFSEFTVPTGCDHSLSAQQIDIIRKLIRVFEQDLQI